MILRLLSLMMFTTFCYHTLAQSPFRYIVSGDGTGDYSSIQEAIDACPDDERSLIFIKNGTYEEKLCIGSKNNFSQKLISLIGEDTEKVIITSNQKMDDPSLTWDSVCTVRLYCDDFYAENLTLYNNAGIGAQAITLYSGGDRQTFRNCHIRGYQDTYRTENAKRCYFQNCLLEGTVDFIYAGGAVFFDNCELRCIKGGGYITAPGGNGTAGTIKKGETEAGIFYRIGFFFRNCDITAGEGVADGAFSLGRPWQDYAPAYYLNCKMGKHINEKGWTTWDGREATACFCEYKSMDSDGNPLDVSKRVDWSYQLPKADVDKFFYPAFIYNRIDSKFNYDPESICVSPAAPTSFTYSGQELNWSSVDGSLGYMIYKGGKFLTATTETSYTDNTDGKGTYTIRTINNMGVQSSPKTASENITEELLAFPTALGFGKFATGGRGGKVIKVTTLEDDMENPPIGSFRWALKQEEGNPIIIVFDVSGYIFLKGMLSMKRDNVTIAGQSAPGEGICVCGHKVNIGGSKNVIIRNMRFRCGSKDANGNDVTADQSMGCENVENVIFDHCNFGWSAEECVNNQDTHYMTFQWCIVHEGLYDAGHHKGKARSFAAQWGGSQTTFHHNLLANNNSRSPRFNGARNNDLVVYLEYINNVNYNWGKVNAVYGGENCTPNTKWHTHEANMVGNYYKPGPSTNKVHRFFTQTGATNGLIWRGPSYWYIHDNIMEGNSEYDEDNWLGVSTDDVEHDILAEKVDTFIQPKTFYKVGKLDYTFDWETFTLKNKVEDAREAFQNVMEKVGCVVRDSVERRLIREARTGTATFIGHLGGAGIIDDPDECEGFISYPDYTLNRTDMDGDGIDDTWETKHGLNSNDPTDGNYTNSIGYTAVEVYLNSLMGEMQNTDFAPTSINEILNENSAGYQTYLESSTVDQMLVIQSSRNLVYATIYTSSGTAVRKLDLTNGYSFNVEHLQPGMYILCVCDMNGAAESLRFIKK